MFVCVQGTFAGITMTSPDKTLTNPASNDEITGRLCLNASLIFNYCIKILKCFKCFQLCIFMSYVLFCVFTPKTVSSEQYACNFLHNHDILIRNEHSLTEVFLIQGCRFWLWCGHFLSYVHFSFISKHTHIKSFTLQKVTIFTMYLQI